MTPSFVIDASLAMAWCFLDEATPATATLLKRMGDEVALVPGLWFLELTNVLYLAEKKNRIDSNRVAEFIALIDTFHLEVDHDASDRAFGHLASMSGASVDELRRSLSRFGGCSRPAAGHAR